MQRTVLIDNELVGLRARVNGIDQASQQLTAIAQGVQKMTGGNVGVNGGRQPIMEHCAMQFMGIAKDRHACRAWNDRLVNAASQAKPNGRASMKYLMKMAERGFIVSQAVPFTHAAVELQMGNDFPEVNHWASESKFHEWNEELYYSLIARCESEAYSQVKASEDGVGTQAYCMMHRWFTGISGYGTSTRAQQLMMPSPPKHAWQIVNSIDIGMENVRMLESMSESYKLPPTSKLEAVRSMMTGQRAKLMFEQLDSNTHIYSILDEEREEAVNELNHQVRECALKARLEELTKKAKPTAMAVDGVNGCGGGKGWSNETPFNYSWEPYPDMPDNVHQEQDIGVDALGKGKGKKATSDRGEKEKAAKAKEEEKEKGARPKEEPKEVMCMVVFEGIVVIVGDMVTKLQNVGQDGIGAVSAESLGMLLKTATRDP